MSNAKMTEARQLIEAGRYDEARALLIVLDHPIANQWLKKIEGRHTVVRSARYSDINSIIAEFIKSDWQLTSQTERTANLEKRAKTSSCAVLIFALISVGVFFFVDIILGLIVFLICLGLIALNNVTQGKKTAYIVADADGGVTITSKSRRVNRRYPPGYRGQIYT